eukprot:3149235-Prymnesium_polylepis.1
MNFARRERYVADQENAAENITHRFCSSHQHSKRCNPRALVITSIRHCEDIRQCGPIAHGGLADVLHPDHAPPPSKTDTHFT